VKASRHRLFQLFSGHELAALGACSDMNPARFAIAKCSAVRSLKPIRSLGLRRIVFQSSKGRIRAEPQPPLTAKIALTSGSANIVLRSLARAASSPAR
jgi:hypothetical protein